ncbi:MAG TPA: FlgD immunoglobulin-like domain containing protein [Candidatus Eisenbacteria bacterium]|nr:FlgD immunoglobulin-like domain containing protein [Candidatus Eisenbacteria bacterium]
MKRLPGLVAMVVLVTSMMPGIGYAGFRGAFDPIGRADIAAADGLRFGLGLANGEQTPTARPMPVGEGNGIPLLERWITFTTRDQVVGFEGSREIWQMLNRTQPGTLVATIAEARSKVLGDPTGVVSYVDPKWSPNGKYLAYVLTNTRVTQSQILVQEFTVSTDMFTSITPVGAPITVTPMVAGVRDRHPDWSPDGDSLVFDSNRSGFSADVYTVSVFPTVGIPVRHTFLNERAEQNPVWAPDGSNRVAFDTNAFGPNVIEIVDLNTDAVSLAETNLVDVSHSHPGWSSDGASIYYDAPEEEDPQRNPDIWKLDLASQAKCPIHMDGAGDVNVSVSRYQNVTPDGKKYNNIYFESQAFAGSLGTPNLIVWRANPIQSCEAPLPIAIEFSPSTFNFDAGNANHGQTEKITATLSFPPETQAAGYQALSFNGPREGLRLRVSGLFSSPLLFGSLRAMDEDPADVFPDGNGPGGNFKDSPSHGKVSMYFSARDIQSRLVSLGLVNQDIPVQVNAYSNIVGRTFQGFGIFHVSSSSLAGSAVKLEQNAPNPFNPVTTIRFAVSRDSRVALRVYNVRGQLVKTLADERMAQGMHEVNWDGRDTSGSHVASGVYYARVASEGGATDVIKMVMAK